jgi:NCAIR mutase (PurE)-related protein
MDSKLLKGLLEKVRNGEATVGDTLKRLRDLPYENLDFARVDHHRAHRTRIPEVVFAANKKVSEVAAIAHSMHRTSGRFLITRATEEMHAAIGIQGAEFFPDACIIACGMPKRFAGSVLVMTAGTSDIPVAEEASLTLQFLGSKTERLYDAGVAGLHRVLDQKERFSAARVFIVVAGMEGALPSVVGGMTDKPVIAVPTSVGYGTSFGGLTALFAMLNSCVPGLAVVNIDNGFGAGCLAHRINTKR